MVQPLRHTQDKKVRRNKEKYITLKEAAEISGYTPDYVGQLIRKGKLPGKQVYCTVQWMTTAEAIQQYIQTNNNSNRNKKQLSTREKVREWFIQVKNGLLLQFKLAKLFKTVLYLTIVFSVLFSLFLFYIFSVSFDNTLQQRAIEKLEASVLEARI